MSAYKYLNPDFLKSVRDLMSEVAPAAAGSRELVERLEASNDILTTLLHFPLAPSCEVSVEEIEACIHENRTAILRENSQLSSPETQVSE